MSSENLRALLPAKRIELLSSGKLLEGGKFKFLEYLLSRSLSIGGDEMASAYEKIWQSLKDRELSMSTGVGLGVAIPHCSSPSLHDICMYMTVLSDPIDFQSIDDIPVRIVVLILFPQQKFERHVHLLSCLARILNKAQTREKILKAPDPTEVRKIMLQAQGAFEKKLEKVRN